MSNGQSVYKESGEATFICDEHKREAKVSWGAGYPKIPTPVCPESGHTMTLKAESADPHEDSLLEEVKQEESDG